MLIVSVFIRSAPLHAQHAWLERLDHTLDSVAEYDKRKEARISKLKEKASQSADTSQRYDGYRELYQEYQAYICDSAIHYSKSMLALAIAHHHDYWINEAKLQLAKAYASSGLYHEALPMMGAIAKQALTAEQLGNYYLTYADTYIYLGEYAGPSDNGLYVALKNSYEDSARMVLPKHSYNYLILSGKEYIESGEFKKAHQVLAAPELRQVANDTRNYAIYTSVMAYGYAQQGHVNRQQEFLAQAAMADIRASVKENISFRNLAELLLNEGEINRANRYIKKSMDDANFYNARLRNIQTSKVFPIIDKSYQLEREHQRKRLQTLLAAISVLSVFLIIAIAKVIRQNKRLAKARQALAETNLELKQLNSLLSESNHIKEEYIGRFLDLCSSYIDKMEDFRKSLNKKAALRKFDEISKQLKSADYLDDELRDFYHNFDVAFLNIFPDFVDHFNLLLSDEERIHPKQPDSLTPELRIFALMRLGITDGTKIARFLRFSVTTIYNYRSKYRNKALIPRDDFEKEIMKIGNLAIGPTSSPT